MTPALRQNLTLAVLVLTGINMRPLLTSIGPLLPDIRAASGMSYTLAALLTALPVIAMGVLALAAGWVDRYIGQKRSIALSLLIIAAGALLRNRPEWWLTAHQRSGRRNWHRHYSGRHPGGN